MDKDTKDYFDGLSGNPWAPGLGQVGHAESEARQRRKRERDERDRKALTDRATGSTPQGGLVFAMLAMIFLASGAQLAGFNVYAIATEHGWLTRYANLPAWGVCAASLLGCLVVGRGPMLWDRVLIVSVLAVVAANAAGWLTFGWSHVLVILR